MKILLSDLLEKKIRKKPEYVPNNGCYFKICRRPKKLPVKFMNFRTSPSRKRLISRENRSNRESDARLLCDHQNFGNGWRHRSLLQLLSASAAPRERVNNENQYRFQTRD